MQFLIELDHGDEVRWGKRLPILGASRCLLEFVGGFPYTLPICEMPPSPSVLYHAHVLVDPCFPSSLRDHNVKVKQVNPL